MRFRMFYQDQEIEGDTCETLPVVFHVPTAWIDAPRDGLQAVVKHGDDGRLVRLEGRDLYSVLQGGEPFCTDDIVPTMRAAGLVKSGLQLPDEEFAEVRERIRAYVTRVKK